jgi:hypothetical protein
MIWGICALSKFFSRICRGPQKATEGPEKVDKFTRELGEQSPPIFWFFRLSRNKDVGKYAV